MKTILARMLCVLLMVAPTSAATYYVNNDAGCAGCNDEAGCGDTAANACDTIQYAYGLITEAATMHEIVVSPGAYEETAGSGYAQFGGVGAVGDIHCTIRSSTGDPDDVTITSSGTRTIRIHTTLADTAHLKFKDISVLEDQTGHSCFDFADTGSLLELQNCKVTTNHASGAKGILWGSSCTTRRLRVTDCTFATTGNAIELGTSGTGGTPDADITGNTITISGAAAINAAIFAPYYWKGLRVHDNTITINKSANGCIGIYAGFDGGDSATPTTGSPVITDNTIDYLDATSHGILVGYGANGATVTGNTISRANPAIVFKGDGCVIANNTFHGAGGILLKGAQRNSIIYNTCYTTTTAAAIRIEQQASANLTALTWTDATDTLSKASTFVAYNSFRTGDYFQITAGTSMTAAYYAIVSRNAANGIVLPADAGSGDSSDVAGSLKHLANNNTVRHNICVTAANDAAIKVSAALTDYVGGFNLCDENLYWSTYNTATPKIITIDGTTYTTAQLANAKAAWGTTGSGRYVGTPYERNDAGSLIANPVFLSTDPTHENFLKIRASSPAAYGRERAWGGYQPPTGGRRDHRPGD